MYNSYDLYHINGAWYTGESESGNFGFLITVKNNGSGYVTGSFKKESTYLLKFQQILQSLL